MTIPKLAIAVLTAAILMLPLAASAAEHDHNHAQPAATTAPATTSGKAVKSAVADQLKSMHDMHAKMLAARTPAARRKLMAENMKLMQDSMDMMKDMRPEDCMKKMDMMGKGDAGKERDDAGTQGKDEQDMMDKHAMMEKMDMRMDMMESMMQMMMDQQSSMAR